MAFKDTIPEFQMIDVSLIDPHPDHPRRHVDEAALNTLATSIRRKGLIHPLVVQPAGTAGRYVLVVGERRRRAAILAGEKLVPVLVHACGDDELLAVQVFENMGGGMRVALESRDMSRAIQRVADGFESPGDAAEEFGRKATWLNQATAAANLSPKVSTLLEAGKISSTGAAVRLEKLAQKNAAKAERLIARVEQMPEGETLSRRAVDEALCEEGGRARKKVAPSVLLEESASPSTAANIPPREEVPAVPVNPARRRISASKVKMVAEILGLSNEDEEDVFAKLIDEFLALKGGLSSGE